jgi:hypothetical protein
MGGQRHALVTSPRGKKTRYLLYRKLGGPRVDWAGAENLSCNGFRIPDRPACSESLYRPHFLGRPDARSFMLQYGAVMKQEKTCVMLPLCDDTGWHCAPEPKQVAC